MDEEYKDLELIVETVTDYFLGMYESDIERLKRAFAEEALVIGYYQGFKSFLTLDQFADFVKGAPVPKENGEPYDMKIVSLDITVNVAVVKVEDLYQGLKFTDYLSLLKIEEKWLIVNKTFRHE